jgi:hypothetical protein
MENKDGYELDPTLETVLEEQMIEGGVPESEVAPSIKDIEEAMDERLKEKKGNQEYDAEAYASVPEEFNQKLIELMGHMRAAGVPQETIMYEIRDLIDIYVNSATNNMESNNQVISMDNNSKASKYDHKFEEYKEELRAKGKKKHHGEKESNVSLDRQTMPNEHLGWYAEDDDNAGYTDEELYAIDNPAEPSAAEKVAEYLDKYDEEGSELWTHLWEGSRALSNGNVEDGSAHLRILIEIFQNLLAQLDQGHTAKTSASEPMGLDTKGWTITDYQWGQTNRPDYLEYVLLEHPTQGWIQADGIDIDYEGGTVNFSTETHGLPSGPYENLVDIDRGNTQASFKTVGYFSPQNDTDVPDVTFDAQDAPSDIIDIVNSYVSEDESINEAIDTHLAENPPEPDWDSMPGGADW